MCNIHTYSYNDLTLKSNLVSIFVFSLIILKYNTVLSRSANSFELVIREPRIFCNVANLSQ